MEMKELFYQIKDGLILCRVDANCENAMIIAVNEAATEIFNKKDTEMLNASVLSFFKIDPNMFQRRIGVREKKSWSQLIDFNAGEIAPKQVDINFYPMTHNQEDTLMLVVRDVSLENKRIEKLSIFKSIYNHSKDGIMIFDHNHRLEWVNQKMYALSGVEKHWMIGMQIGDLKETYPSFSYWEPIKNALTANEDWEGEVWQLRQEDVPLILRINVFKIKNEFLDTENIGVSISDVTELRTQEKEIEYLRYRDKLTGLYNLRYLIECLDGVSLNRRAALYFIDLEGFAKINDAYGHIQGDRLLKIVASRLMGCLKKDEIMGRVGSDKFAIQGFMDHGESAQKRALELLDVFSKAIQIEDRQVRMAASLGYAESTENMESVSDLLKAAEIASKHAKPSGGNRIGGYDFDEASRLKKRYQLEHDIRSALDKDELFIKFQPVIRTETGKIAGFESLVRWKHTELGEIPPVEFIPIAESNGTIIAIGDWVLAETFSCLKTISNFYEEQIYASINVSIRQLEQADFVKRVKRLMERYEVDGKWIEMEITESVYMENIDAIFDNLRRLNEMGIRIAIDDFGTGYSSLSQLFRLDVSKIKIDKSFIDGLTFREDCDRLTEAITLIAKSLNLELVAEGVETEVQLGRLKDLNCDYIQGYYYSKPLNLGEFVKFLNLV